MDLGLVINDHPTNDQPHASQNGDNSAGTKLDQLPSSQTANGHLLSLEPFAFASRKFGSLTNPFLGAGKNFHKEDGIPNNKALVPFADVFEVNPAENAVATRSNTKSNGNHNVPTLGKRPNELPANPSPLYISELVVQNTAGKRPTLLHLVVPGAKKRKVEKDATPTNGNVSVPYEIIQYRTFDDDETERPFPPSEMSQIEAVDYLCRPGAAANDYIDVSTAYYFVDDPNYYEDGGYFEEETDPFARRRPRHERQPITYGDSKDVFNKTLYKSIIEKDLPRAHRYFVSFSASKLALAKRSIQICQKEVRKRAFKAMRSNRELAVKAKRTTREMLLYHRRSEREEKEARKKADKEAAERRKKTRRPERLSDSNANSTFCSRKRSSSVTLLQTSLETKKERRPKRRPKHKSTWKGPQLPKKKKKIELPKKRREKQPKRPFRHRSARPKLSTMQSRR
eukprot:TRINITY_DN10352_c0_g1_i2.p1 TRINITY_DN10352_c0_g1~~TRINITY_DN10352_c0_g1_i2.p1  ORF type:complete len:454 (+),score=98.15 TRINITY_DN10352_c0_g1_i2:238-1599(+)